MFVTYLLHSYLTWKSRKQILEKLKKAISGRLSDHFGFKLNDDGSVSSVENVYCLTCHKSNDWHKIFIICIN